MMSARQRRSDQPIGVHGRSSEGPVGHEPAKAGHQRHQLGDPKLRRDGMLTGQRVKPEGFLVCFVVLPSWGFDAWFLPPRVSTGMPWMPCGWRVRVMAMEAMPQAVALVPSDCCTYVLYHKCAI